jgi:hypothetical protein
MGDRQIEPMSDYEVALMDAIRTLAEVLIAKGVVQAKILDEMLEKQSGAYPASEMPGALFVMQTIRETLTDPERIRARALLQKPTEGSA